MSKKVATVFDEEMAMRSMKGWCKERHVQRTHYFSKIFVEIPERQSYWAVVVRLFGFQTFCGVYGFHIYEDGRVAFIGQMEGYDDGDD